MKCGPVAQSYPPLAWLVATLDEGSGGKVTSKKVKAPTKRAATKVKKKAPAERR